MSDNDRAEKISARLAVQRVDADDTRWLLAERKRLLDAVEVAERNRAAWKSSSGMFERNAYGFMRERDEALARVKTAERTGAVEALLDAADHGSSYAEERAQQIQDFLDQDSGA